MQTTNQTVLITGGTSGIGFALAARFLQGDNKVIITGRDQARLEAARALLPGVITEAADMADLQALDRLAAAHPEVTVLVHNAGIQENYQIADPGIDPARIEQELAINLLGPIHLTRQMLPQLLQHSQAAIVAVTSTLAVVPKASAPVYCASKAGLRNFARSLRGQLQNTPVRVFELIPPLVDTAMTAGRGQNKITPAAVATAFWHGFATDKLEIRVGQAGALLALHRLVPQLIEARMLRA
jgi:uncharacterized oxidoreductase